MQSSTPITPLSKIFLVENANVYDDMVEVITAGNKSSDQIEALTRVTAYKEWIDSDKDVFSDNPTKQDKFADLIRMSRLFDKTSEFFIAEVGVNAATVWRWANEKSRPSKYLVKSLIVALNDIILKTVKEDIEQLRAPHRATYGAGYNKSPSLDPQ